MKHLFQNSDGELVAADTVEQAAHYHDCQLGGDEEPQPGWSQVPDDKVITVHDDDDPEGTSAKTAREWAEDCDVAEQIATTYR
jgi:hypothetical protein